MATRNRPELDRSHSEPMTRENRIRWRVIAADRGPEFFAKGHRQRSFFPHRVAFLPRPGPDGYKLAERMCGWHDRSSLWEVVLFADDAMLAEFPLDLFFDDELLWHRQHFGRPGQVACANVFVAIKEMWSMSHFSDLVQRIGRRREHKTRIERRFKGWHDMLLNALLALAVDRGVRRLRIPTSSLQIKHTDPRRSVRPELFERVYDRSVNPLFEATHAGGSSTSRRHGRHSAVCQVGRNVHALLRDDRRSSDRVWLRGGRFRAAQRAARSQSSGRVSPPAVAGRVRTALNLRERGVSHLDRDAGRDRSGLRNERFGRSAERARRRALRVGRVLDPGGSRRRESRRRLGPGYDGLHSAVRPLVLQL